MLKRKHSHKEKLSKVLSNPDLAHGKTKAVARKTVLAGNLTPDLFEEPPLSKLYPRKNSHVLNLQIPSTSGLSKQFRQSMSIYRNVRSPQSKLPEEDEKTANLTKINREKNTLLAQVTGLQQEIYLLKNENKTLKGSLRKIKQLERALTEAYAENEQLQSADPRSWSRLENDMTAFRELLSNSMPSNR